MMFCMKNSAMFNSLIIICDRIQNQSDFLQFWKIFNLMKILIDLLKLWKSVELLEINLLLIFLHLWDCTVCYSCEQFISIWEFIILIWMKMNSEMSNVSFFMSCSWLKNIWRCFSWFSFCMSFWKTFSDLFWRCFSWIISFSDTVEITNNWFKHVWKRFFWIFLFNFIDTMKAFMYLHDLCHEYNACWSEGWFSQ